MIEGLHIEVTSAELKEHIQERANHHQKRGKWYAEQADQLQAGHEQEERLLDRHSHSFDPLDGLMAKKTEHKNKAAFFQFMADHIVPNETYRLSEEDLTRIEIYSRFF